MYIMRAVGGTIYFTGVIVMAYNIIKTVRSGSLVSNEAVEAPARAVPEKHAGEHWHRWIERRPIQMLVFSAIAILIGGIIEIFPMMFINDNVPKIESVKPYTALEWEGRDLYIREGCVSCHSQMVRPFRSETARYGDYSKSGEFIYDRPFLWGSKRTGPDLAREGAAKLKKSDAWHYNHMIDPRAVSAGSIMPAYPFLAKDDLNTDYTKAKLKILKQLGTPYTNEYIQNVEADMQKQAMKIAKSLNREGIGGEGLENKEIIALIAYLQRLGTDIEPDPQAGN